MRFSPQFMALLERRIEHLELYTSEQHRNDAEDRRRQFEEAVWGCRDGRRGIGMGIVDELDELDPLWPYK